MTDFVDPATFLSCLSLPMELIDGQAHLPAISPNPGDLSIAWFVKARSCYLQAYGLMSKNGVRGRKKKAQYKVLIARACTLLAVALDLEAAERGGRPSVVVPEDLPDVDFFELFGIPPVVEDS